ncbi:hypothetical protein [Tenacibaculum retecalamus]|uniref:hypothetical protein n=1 Tax=Tenacibaculum retecalamus TaxID=3018315 RepID=UPI0023D926A6|nr:hypothetical protein [Tenacibaculum retecalamus]WBX70975.1 hypothetical protein PG912_12285 [Tenacibaculum retecalamus]
MKKIIATLLFVNSFVVLQAQKLENKIPNNADVVIMANATNLFDLISVSDVNESIMGKEILKNINRKREEKITSVSKAGFDTASNAYYFFQKNDSISYHTFLVELNDKALFESMLSERDLKKIKKENDYSYIQGYSELRIWNDDVLLIINGDKSRSYLKKHNDRFEKLKEEGESIYSVRKRFAQLWTKKHAFSILENSTSNGIATNSSFQKGKKKGSVATLWVRNYGMLMSDLIGSFSRNLSSSMNYFIPQEGKNIYGVEEVTANLFFNENNASILLDMAVSDDMSKSFKKIYNKKMSSTLINSFDHNKALAFWSVSMDTEELLKQYPEMINKMYGGIVPKFKEEVDVAGDLLSLLVDEAAIAKLVTGDALFVLNGFSEKDVTYTTYKYDADYKRKEVTKTKKTVVPDFTLMIGSEEKELLNKIFRLGQKHKTIIASNNVYEFIKKSKELPFNIYAVIKNDVLYITTSKVRAINIEAGRANYKATKHSKLIKRNSSVVYTDINALIKNMPTEWFGRNERKMASISKENVKDISFRVSKVKGNKISSELRLNTKGKEENTLKLLFKVINEIAK